MDAAWEAGITHFDTADAYGGGRSERDDRPLDARRAAYGRLLTTKTFNPMERGRRPRPRPGADRAAAATRASSGSASTASTLYLAHEFDPDVDAGGRVDRGAREHQRAGRIGGYRRRATSTPRSCARRSTPAPLGRDPELLLAAACAATRPSCCRCARDEHVAYTVYSPLARRLADRQVPARRPFPAGSRMTQRPEPYAALASEATFDALERARGSSPRAAASRWRRWRSPGCWATSGSGRSWSDRCAPSISTRARGARAPAHRGRARTARRRCSDERRTHAQSTARSTQRSCPRRASEAMAEVLDRTIAARHTMPLRS